MKKFWSFTSAVFGCASIFVGSILFGNLGVAIGWIVMFAVMALSDFIYMKKNNKNEGRFYLQNTPWAAMGAMLATMAHAIMVGMTEE